MGKGKVSWVLKKAKSLLSLRTGWKTRRAAVQAASLHYLGGMLHQSLLDAISNHTKQNLVIGIGQPMVVKLKCLTNYSSMMRWLAEWTGRNQWKLFILISKRFLTSSLTTLITNSSFSPDFFSLSQRYVYIDLLRFYPQFVEMCMLFPVKIILPILFSSSLVFIFTYEHI